MSDPLSRPEGELPGKSGDGGDLHHALPDVLKHDFANLRLALVTRYRMVQDSKDPKLAGKLLAELMRFAADVNTDVAELVDDFLVKLAASRR